MLDFLKRNRKNIIKILIALLIIVALSVAAMLILKACGVIYWDEEDNMEINKEISEKDSWTVQDIKDRTDKLVAELLIMFSL